MDKQKSNLLEAYVRKAIALSKLFILDGGAAEKAAAGGDERDQLNSIYTDVGKFMAYTDAKVIMMTLWYSYRHQHYGRMMKCLQKIYEEKLQRDVLDEQRLVANELKMNHICTLLHRTAVTANPLTYRLF